MYANMHICEYMEAVTMYPVYEPEIVYFVLHNSVSASSAILSFRRSRKHGQYDRKFLKCPYCEWHLTDVDIHTKVEIFRYPMRSDIKCHNYIKCGRCHKEVGINYF